MRTCRYSVFQRKMLEKNNKNAIHAGNDRLNKKTYVEDLEVKVSPLARENDIS